MAKTVKSKGAKSAVRSKKNEKKVKVTKSKVAAKVLAAPKRAEKKAVIPAQGASKSAALAPIPEAVAKEASKKALSQKLLDTIEKRKQGKEASEPRGSKFYVKPPGRRGRRPKNLVDYTPSNQEEDSYVLESEQESIEYDTGIRAAEHRDDGNYSMDRFEDFDEELNFDW